VVISIDLTDLPTLAANFEAQGFYVAGLADVMTGSLQCLNITHLETIENVDLMISGREEYDLIKFDRRRSYTLPGSGEVAIASPEDVIIKYSRKINYTISWLQALSSIESVCN
jgi:hypothetical protein